MNDSIRRGDIVLYNPGRIISGAPRYVGLILECLSTQDSFSIMWFRDGKHISASTGEFTGKQWLLKIGRVHDFTDSDTHIEVFIP